MRLVDAVAFAERHPSQAVGPRKKHLGVAPGLICNGFVGGISEAFTKNITRL